MAYLEKADFKSVIREYQLDAITDNDDTIVDRAIEAAIEEVASIFIPNDQKIWEDGRPIYDVDAIFNTTGADRNALMLTNVMTVAVWQLLFLCNTGIVYQEAQDRYDRTIIYLNELATGVKNSRTLPRIVIAPPDDKEPYRTGSRRKFNHE